MTLQGWHDDRPRKRASGRSSTIPLFEAPRAPQWRSWFVILLSVVVVVVLTMVNRGSDTETQEAAISDEVVIQSRQALSLMGLETEDLILIPMRDLATTPSATRRVATTYAALDRGDGLRSLIALSLMSRIPTQVAEGAPLGAPGDLDGLLVQAFYHPLELSGAERDYIVENVGWPARMLFVRDLEEANPQRVALHKQAERNATRSSAMVAIGLLIAMVGSGLLLSFYQRWRRQQIVVELSEPQTSEAIYLEAFAVYLALMASAGLIAKFSGSGAVLALALQVLSAVLGVAWPSLRGVPLRVMMQDIGLHRGQGVFTELWAGVVGYVTILPIFGAGVVAMIMLQKILAFAGLPLTSPVHPEMVGLGDSSLSVRIYVIVAAVIVAPIVEEMLFRGAFYRALRQRWSFVVSAVVVGVIFALLHPQGLLSVPALAAIGIGLSGLREWRDSLIAPIFAHALHNGLLIALTLTLVS